MKNAPKGFKKEYMERLLTQGLASKLQRDSKGNLTGLYSKNKPTALESIKLDPIGTVAKAMMPGPFGLISGVFDYFNTGERYTGYNPNVTTTKNNMGDDNNEEVPSGVTTLVNNPIDQYRRSIDIYNLNPNRYKLFG